MLLFNTVSVYSWLTVHVETRPGDSPPSFLAVWRCFNPVLNCSWHHYAVEPCWSPFESRVLLPLKPWASQASCWVCWWLVWPGRWSSVVLSRRLALEPFSTWSRRPFGQSKVPLFTPKWFLQQQSQPGLEISYQGSGCSPAKLSRIVWAMLISRVEDTDVGSHVTTVIEVLKVEEGKVFGREVPSGVLLAFELAGMSPGCQLTLYHATKTASVLHDAVWLTLDPAFPPLITRPSVPSDVTFSMDLCCGVGGFCTALHFMNHQVIAAVDFSDLAISAFSLNHFVPTLCADLHEIDTIHWLHTQQVAHGCQALITCGYPCQPLSKQGHQRGSQDSRSQTLLAVLEASFLLQSCGLLLECVPEAICHGATQKALREHAEVRGFSLHQKVLHLHDTWSSRRSRCFSLLIPASWGVDIFAELPKIHPAPCVRDLIPSGEWPAWNPEEEKQLQWTEVEKQAFENPTFGSTNRQVDMSQPLATALHSWGSPLTACPCGCRQTGFSLRSLMSMGLRGVEIKATPWPHHSRHIHPRELQLLLGFPPLQQHLKDCKEQLCLYGNSASPIQCVWILAHLHEKLQIGISPMKPKEVLSEYFRQLLTQRDVTWPSPKPGVGTLTLKLENKDIQIAFDSLQTVGSLCHAEAILQQEAKTLQLQCEGLTLPSWAYLQEKEYYVVGTIEALDMPLQPVPIAVAFLGVTKLFVVPASYTHRTLMNWLGIDDFLHLKDEQDRPLDLRALVQPWTIVIVQSNPDSLLFQIGAQELGFGFASEHAPGRLTLSEPWVNTDLWRQDQLARTSLLLTWIGLDFASLTVWLPSFADAIIEKWPCFTDAPLKTWLQAERTTIFALFFERTGWNLLRLDFDTSTTKVKYFEDANLLSPAAVFLAKRAHEASGRDFLCEVYAKEPFRTPDRTLAAALSCLDCDLGFSPLLVQTLAQVRQQFDEATDFGTLEKALATCSATEPWTPVGAQLPILDVFQNTQSGRGIAAKFLHRVAHSLATQHTGVAPGQIKVLLFDSLNNDSLECVPLHFVDGLQPLFLFVLHEYHWTFVHCTCEHSRVSLVQFDGLQKGHLGPVTQIGQAIKKAWNASSLQITTSWKVPQTRPDSCGTIALAHFALQVGLITHEQATHFEGMHDGLAILSSFITGSRPDFIGWGATEQAVTQQLAEILPEKGVAKDEVQARIKQALKTFGAPALGKALESPNAWKALKTLGNSRPRPFMWVTHTELQQHIKDRAQQNYGVSLDQKKSKKAKETKSRPPTIQHIDPDSLVLPPGVLITNSGEPLPQIPLATVQKDAKGIAFATASDASPYLADAKLISPEALAILIIGAVPGDIQQSLPMHSMQVPAIYKGTGEAILVDCISVQLGDQAVYRKINTEAPKLASFPTEVLRVHIFRDQWGTDQDWLDFVEHPVKQVVQMFPVLRLCRTENCEPPCKFYHPSIEEEGIEGGLLDVWAFRWNSLDGQKQQPSKAEVLSVFIRIPESSFADLHVASGTGGVYFEPRNQDSPGPDASYAVVWTPQLSLQDVQHRVKTLDAAIAACRLGTKFGVRCKVKHQQELHAILCPNKPFVQCNVKAIYRLEPLPAGTQRQSLVDLLQASHWTAKPLQPCKGSMGRAWEVGAESAPANHFLEAQHGWITVTKVRDAVPPPKTQDLVATAKTRQHIHSKGASTSTPAAGSDPWLSKEQDPWQSWKGPSPATVPSSTHVQKKFDDVEQRLQSQVQAAVQHEMSQMQVDTSSDRNTMQRLDLAGGPDLIWSTWPTHR